MHFLRRLITRKLIIENKTSLWPDLPVCQLVFWSVSIRAGSFPSMPISELLLFYLPVYIVYYPSLYEGNLIELIVLLRVHTYIDILSVLRYKSLNLLLYIFIIYYILNYIYGRCLTKYLQFIRINLWYHTFKQAIIYIL